MAKYEVKSLYVSLPHKLDRNDRFGNKMVVTWRYDRGQVIGTAKMDKADYHYTEDTSLLEKLAEQGHLEKVVVATQEVEEKEEQKEPEPEPVVEANGGENTADVEEKEEKSTASKDDKDQGKKSNKS